MDVNPGRRNYSLLFALLLAGILTACGASEAVKPDLPASISPGWKLTSMESSPAPARLPAASPPPPCWKASYGNEGGSASVWVCGYTSQSGAFDALQRMNPGPDEVRIQKGRYLVVTQWTAVPRAQVTVLMTAIERALPE